MKGTPGQEKKALCCPIINPFCSSELTVHNSVDLLLFYPPNIIRNWRFAPNRFFRYRRKNHRTLN